MTLLFQVLRAAYCRGTHHKLALDALSLLRGPKALRWQSVFLRHYEHYLEGSKDPDTVFRDFENHVLHVQSGYWGGSCERARYWYEATVRALEKQRWEVAAYNAGVLGHYVTDPMMPLHTAQSAAETNVHRAMEWSISRTYDPICELMLEETGLPQVEAGTHESWLEELVTAGAEIANRYYHPLIEQYDFVAGAKNPPKGLNLRCREMAGQMLAFATVSLARILERACEEAALTTEPPLALPSFDWFLAALEAPLEVVLGQLEKAREGNLVRAQLREFLSKGVVDQTLTEDVRVIRDLCGQPGVPADPEMAVSGGAPAADAVEVLETSTPETVPVSSPTAAGGGEPEPPAPAVEKAPRERRRLALEDPVVEAPSIGPKTAVRLEAAGVLTVADLLRAEPAALAEELDAAFVNEKTVRDWQDQCRLLLDLPRLRGRDAQILVGAGYRSAASIAGRQPEQLLTAVEPFLNSEAGARVLRDGRRPGLREATLWVGCAEEAASRAGAPELVS